MGAPHGAVKTKAGNAVYGHSAEAARHQSLLARGPGGLTQREPGSAYFLPQHRSVPTLTSLLSTPATGLPAIRVTPVST